MPKSRDDMTVLNSCTQQNKDSFSVEGGWGLGCAFIIDKNRDQFNKKDPYMLLSYLEK